MDLNDLRNRAENGRSYGDFSCAYMLSEVLYKLKKIVINKFLEIKHGDRFEYFEKLGFEIKISEIAYEGDRDYVPITFSRRHWNKPTVQFKIPVEVADKILVIGLP